MARSTGDDAVRARSSTCRRSTPAAPPACSTCPTRPAAAAPTIRCAAGSSSPRASRCRPRSARSSGAAPSARSSSTPASNVHEGICTSIWGAPTAESLGRKPTVPVVCINHPDGEQLIADVQRGPVRASIKTWLREGWMRCLLPVVEIRGHGGPRRVPARPRPLRLLVRGHRRQRHRRCGAARTGARPLEPARPPEAQRCASPGGRATPPAATPGRRGTPTPSPTRSTSTASPSSTSTRPAAPGATAYEEVMWMAEADALCRTSIQDALGLPLGAGAAAARRRLFVQPDRPDRPLHAALEHPDRGAQAARLLRRRRLRRQHRLAHARRPDAGGRPRDPAPRPGGLPHDHRPHPERAAAPVRLHRGDRRGARRGGALPRGRGRRGRLRAAARRPDGARPRPAPTGARGPRPASARPAPRSAGG